MDDNGKEGHFKPERFAMETKEKQKAKIDSWRIVNYFGTYVLVGTVKDHPRQEDFQTDTQSTSELLSIDLVNKVAETRNTTYELLNKGE